MNITGIITEYNPFHRGHKYHLDSAIKDTNSDGIVCIMSGNFVQRGGPAIIDKFERAKIAVLNGVDLVLELPTFYAISSAEYFAKGAVTILHNLGVVNNLYFGSESGNIDSLIKITKVLVEEPLTFKNDLKTNLSLGLPYIKARENSLKNFFENKDVDNNSITTILNNSNNILGIEYIKALINLNSQIKPITLRREGSLYNEKNLNKTFSSATSIRENIKENKNLDNLSNHLTNETFDSFSNLNNNKYKFSFENDMFNFIKYRIISNNILYYNLKEIVEGLDKKLFKEILKSNSYDDLILNVKSKRYTYTKISRILTQIFLSLDFYDSNELIKDKYLYARVLAFNCKGKEILKLMKKTSTIPIITKVPKNHSNPLLEFDINATKAYSLLNSKVNPLSDYLKHPFIKY